MFCLVRVTLLEKSIQSLFLIGIILLARRYFNLKSTKKANVILWLILFSYLLIPYSILINIGELRKYGISGAILDTIVFANSSVKLITRELAGILNGINRVVVAVCMSTYTIHKIYKKYRELSESKIIENDIRINKYIELFDFRRKITVLVNDNLKVPITYGVLKPKIIVQSHILEDDELLKFVMIHELSHIQRYDIVLTYIKNLIACIYWYNIFVLIASRYMEDDIEILCDKSVIEKVGDTLENRKNYCISMLKLIEKSEKKSKFVLKLNPTKERILIMRKWKKSLAGVLIFIMVATMSTTVFADVKKEYANQVVITKGEPVKIDNRISNDKVKIISDEEYKMLKFKKEIPINQLRVADINQKETLSGVTSKTYSFTIRSWSGANHNSFVIKLSDMSCKSDINYEIIIQENGTDIYRDTFHKDTNLTMKAQENSYYNVIIHNNSTSSLKYNIKINSYLEK